LANEIPSWGLPAEGGLPAVGDSRQWESSGKVLGKFWESSGEIQEFPNARRELLLNITSYIYIYIYIYIYTLRKKRVHFMY
jgi:hypothetical protein